MPKARSRPPRSVARRIAPFVSLLPPLLVAGCGTSIFATRATDPVVIDGFYGNVQTPYYEVVSTTAGRRSIFVQFRNPDGTRVDKPHICSEPPPDAVDALANSLTLSAKGGAGGSNGPQGSVDFSHYYDVASQLGLYRSQGLQFLRDQTFQLCLRAIMTTMSPSDWAQQQQSLISTAETLIEKEMPAIAAAKNAATTVQAKLAANAGSPPTAQAQNPPSGAGQPPKTPLKANGQ